MRAMIVRTVCDERIGMAAVIALAATIFLLRLGETALWSEEVRWAEIPREMQLKSDFLHPTINGKTYYDKPLGSYVLVLAAGTLRGEIDEWAARLPCALSALLGVALIMAIARQLYSNARTAAVAGLALATSFSYVFFARHASADMENVAGVLAALWLYLKYGERGGWWVVALWLVMAVTSLTKGLLGFALPLLVIGADRTLAAGLVPKRGHLREWIAAQFAAHRWFFNRFTPPAMLLGAVIFLGPFWLSYRTNGSAAGLAMVYRENVQRFFNPVNHRGPVYLYVWAIFMLLAPWSALLPAALWSSHRLPVPDQVRARGDRFVRIWFWTLFLFFTLSSSRRSYYLLPILPPAALLIARMLTNPEAFSRRTVQRLLGFGQALLLGATLISGVALLPVSLRPMALAHLPGLPNPQAFAMIWLLCAVVAVWAMLRANPGRVLASTSVLAVGLSVYLNCIALPGAEELRTQKAFAERIGPQVRESAGNLAFFHNREIAFYLGLPEPAAEYESPAELAEAVRAGKVRWVIARRRDRDSLGVAARLVDEEPAFAWEAPERVGNKLALLEVGP